MGTILCATRGGEASHRTQDAAIALAKERGDELCFLYVVDLRFLDKTAAPIVVDVESELVKMGEFLLAIACERAAAQGVQAEMCVRRGPFLEALESAALEEGADAIAFGQPAGPESAFSLADLERLTARIEADTGIKTYII